MGEKIGGEVELIRELARVFGPGPPEVVAGIGDDSAVLDLGQGECLLWTVDTLVEGVHFELSYMNWAQLGRKALAVNVSDIAAMGGEARYALFSLGWPPEKGPAGALAVGQGLAQAAWDYGVAVIGGDTVASPLVVTVTVTVLGRAPMAEIIRRSGAQVGDLIYVTGPLGAAAAGLALLQGQASLPQDVAEPLVRAHLDPQPRLAAGRLLARNHLATAMIDLSDGVAADLRHLCQAGGVGARLLAEKIPLAAGVKEAARVLGREALELALRGGEDYEILFTSPPRRRPSLLAAFAEAGLPPPLEVGEIIPGEEVLLVMPEGGHKELGAGFDHFRETWEATFPPHR